MDIDIRGYVDELKLELDFDIEKLKEKMISENSEDENKGNKLYCDYCGDEIYSGDAYYDIDIIETILHEYCLREWADAFIRMN